MTLIQFQVLAAVVEARSFTKAADALHMTQSAVSQTIHSLETELGVTLLNRSRNGVTPTHIGERVLTHVREILYHTRCMVEETKASQGLDVGAIRIGSIPTLSAKLLPEVMGSFKKRFPGVQLVLFEGNYDEVTDWVAESIVDVGLITVRDDGGPLETIPLMEEQWMAFLPATHPLHGSNTVTLEQLKGDALIVSKADADGFIQTLFPKHHPMPSIQFEVQDTATILAMVQEGIGVAILPEMAIAPNPERMTVSALSPYSSRCVGLCVRSMQSVTPAVAEFILHAKELAGRGA